MTSHPTRKTEFNMEKFSLKWNDFQTTVSQSFSLLRREEDFFDVTLVSDDNVQLKAHKLVLSASSSFFKSILKSNQHSHPLLYLHGIDSSNLEFILDYIYQGEVQIHQNQLDPFLVAAKILSISGLITMECTDEVKEEEHAFNTSTIAESDFMGEEITDSTNKVIQALDDKPRNIRSYPLYLQDGLEIQQKIKHMIEKSLDGSFNCSVCGKTGKDYSNMRKHVEIHVEGLSYPCQSCNHTFRSKDSLRNHMYRSHK